MSGGKKLLIFRFDNETKGVKKALFVEMMKSFITIESVEGKNAKAASERSQLFKNYEKRLGVGGQKFKIIVGAFSFGVFRKEWLNIFMRSMRIDT